MLFVALAILPGTLLGQSEGSTGPSIVGIQPLGSYDKTTIDSINLSDLGVHVDIPLFSHNFTRGGESGAGIHLVYDSSYSDNGTKTNDIANVGWRLVGGTAVDGSAQANLQLTNNTCSGSPPSQSGHQFYNYSFTDVTGYVHRFNVIGTVNTCPAENPSGMIYPVTATALDGSGYLLTGYGPTAIVTSPSGINYRTSIFPTYPVPTFQTRTDTNGNTVQYGNYGWLNSVNGNVSTPYTDASGVSVTVSGGAYVPGGNSTPTSRSPTYVQYTDANGSPEQIEITYKMYDVPPNVLVSSPGNYPVGLVDSIVFPDGSSYHFSYQPSPFYAGAMTGQLASIQLPTGGTISYQNTWTTISCGQGSDIINTAWTTGLARITSDGTTTYSRTVQSTIPDPNVLTNFACPIPITSTTVVSRPDASSETIQFVNVQEDLGDSLSGLVIPYQFVYHSYETEHVWRDASNNLMKSTSTCYNGASGNCAATLFDLPISQISTVTTLDDGISAKNVIFLNAQGLPTEKDEYDYGASTPKRKTLTVYAVLGNNILTKPASITVQDGSGNTIGRTTFGYDESSLTPTSGLADHVVISGARGNQTSIHRWVDTTGSTLDQHFFFDDAGQLLTSEDARGNSTQFQYDTTTDSCLTKTTQPPLPTGIVITTTRTCDPNTGLITSSIDPNGNITTYGYDEILRPSSVIYPQGGGSTNISYNSPSLPEVITTTKAASPDPDEVSSTTLDGYGRPVEVNSAGVIVDTGYDEMGRIGSVSNPHGASSLLSDGTTYYHYDGLGRKTTEQQPDGTTLTWQYAGPSSDSWDESGVHTRQTSDALGRLIQVMELGTEASPMSLETDYTYDTLDDLTTVVQHGTAGETSRSRTFTYDSLSRLITSSNPETGAICYGRLTGGSCAGGYDANGNLLYKTDANGVISSYTYDSLNRLTNKSFTDGSRSQVYAYDGKDRFGNTLPIPYSQNAVGRLSQSSDAISVSSHFAYDSMGRLIAQSDCQATGCAYNNQMQATYDLAGNLKSFTFYDGRSVQQTWDGAGRLASIVDSTPGGSGAQYLSGPGSNGGVEYWPSGSVMASTFGNGVTQNFTIDSRLLPCHATASWTVASGVIPLLDRQSFYHSSPTSPCGNEANNNGNIFLIIDNLSGALQSFAYDGLNRLTSAARNDRAYIQTYTYDSFGNMSPTDDLAPQSAIKYEPDPAGTNRLLRSHDGGTTWVDYVYDATGALTQSSDGIGPTHTYQHNAMGQLLSIDGGTDAYLYDGADQRAIKQTPSGSTTYAYFGGKPVAELDQNGNWTDYIYANGQKIAKVGPDTRFHLYGTELQSGWEQGLGFAPPANLVILPGDKLSWRQFNSGVVGGINVHFNSGKQTAWQHAAYDGQQMNQDYVQGQWLYRTADLSGYAGTPQNPVLMDSVQLLRDVATPPGSWSMDIADIALIRADGSVVPIPVSASDVPAAPGSVSVNPSYDQNMYFTVQTYTLVNDPSRSTDNTLHFTHFYIDDHLGSTQMELSSGGWPTWEGQFTPFGQEIVAGQVLSATLGNQQPGDGTNMHYKFTGKERDAESGLDYFGARYYASSMGRWMSPDWSAKAEPVPYSKLSDPQTLNLYNYVQNNPLSQLDDDGHETLHPGDGWDPKHDPERQAQGRPMTTGEKVAFGSGVAAVATLGVSGELEAGAAALWALGSRALTAATSLCIAACPAITAHLNDAAGGFNLGGSWVGESIAGRSSSALAYEQQITGSVGQAFRVNGVNFDGVVNGVLQEAKGPGYERLLGTSFGSSVADKLVSQATSQLKAANGAPITWSFAEQGAANTVRSLFQKQGIKGINVVYQAPK